MVTPKFGNVVRQVIIQQDSNGMWKVETQDHTMSGPGSSIGLLAATPRIMSPLEVFGFIGAFISVTASMLQIQINQGGNNAPKN